MTLAEPLPASPSPYPYGHKWRTVHRPESLKRAGGKFKGGVYIGGAACERCNQADLFLDGRTILEVAHLDGNSSNNAIKNRAALCHSCHRKIDYSSWKAKSKTTRLNRKDGARELLAVGVLEIR